MTAPTPAADRQARRHSIRWMARISLTPAGCQELAAAVEAEFAEVDQARAALADALGLIDAREWADMIDQVRVIRAAATERADLLTEARDALEAAGQNGAHGGDWPAIAPAIRALAAELDTARRAAATNATRWDADLTARTAPLLVRAETAEQQLTAAKAGDAPWITAYREDITAAKQQARAEWAAHEEHRRQLADVLNEPDHAGWLSLIARSRQFVAARRTWKAKAGELEAARDEWQLGYTGLRTALRDTLGASETLADDDLIAHVRDLATRAADAETRATQQGELLEAAEHAGNQAEKARAAAEQRARGLDADLHGTETANEKLRERAEQAEELLRIAHDTSNRAERARASAEEGERRAMEQRQEMAAERHAWQERGARAASLGRQLADMTADRDGWWARALELGETLGRRAERAEATLTAVREAHAHLRVELPDANGGYWDGISEADRLLTAALGDPQPAETDGTDRIVAYRSQLSNGLFCLRCAPVDRTTPLTSDDLNGGPGICCACGADVLAGPDPQDAEMDRRERLLDNAAFAEHEQPAEPRIHVQVTVTPEQVRDAVRRIIREDRIRPGDVIR